MPIENEISILANGNLCLTVPLKIRYQNGRKRIISPETMDEKSDSESSTNKSMVQMIVRGYAWMRMIEEGKIKSIGELTDKTGYHYSHIWRILQVANLYPSLVEAILEGNEPYGLSLSKLKKPVPEIWEEQNEIIFL
jgi:hypothetical protein